MAAPLPAGSSCAIAAEYCAAASANCPPRNSSLPRPLRSPGLAEAWGSSGCLSSMLPAVAVSRRFPGGSALGLDVRPRRDHLLPSLRPISFFWMLPMALAAAVGKGAREVSASPARDPAWPVLAAPPRGRSPSSPPPRVGVLPGPEPQDPGGPGPELLCTEPGEINSLTAAEQKTGSWLFKAISFTRPHLSR